MKHARQRHREAYDRQHAYPAVDFADEGHEGDVDGNRAHVPPAVHDGGGPKERREAADVQDEVERAQEATVAVVHALGLSDGHPQDDDAEQCGEGEA